MAAEYLIRPEQSELVVFVFKTGFAAALGHDHVVRALRRVGAPAEGGRLRATIALPVPREAGTHPTLVAFVQRATTGDVLQTVALPLDRCALP